MIGGRVRGALGGKADDDAAIGAASEGAVEGHEHGGRTGIDIFSLKVCDIDAEQVLGGKRLGVRFDGRKTAARAQRIDDLRLQQRRRLFDPACIGVVVDASAGSHYGDARACDSRGCAGPQYLHRSRGLRFERRLHDFRLQQVALLGRGLAVQAAEAAREQ